MPTATKTSISAEILGISSRLLDACKKRDIPFILSTVSEDFCFIFPAYKGTFFNKQQWLKIVTEIFSIERYEYESYKVMDFGEFAVVSAILNILALPSHSGLLQQYQMMDVWKKEATGWKLVCRQPNFIKQLE